MAPPDNHMNSDGDSGEEEELNINHLSGNQLRAQGEVTISRITDSGVEELHVGGQGDLDIIDIANGSFDVSRPTTNSSQNIIPETTPQAVTDTNITPNPNSARGNKRKKQNKKSCKDVTTTKQLSTRKWVSKDIFPSPEREWERPSFLDNNMTPTELFELFWDSNVIDHIVKESINYAFQKGNHGFIITSDEMKVFISILLLSGYCSVSRRRLYWDKGSDTHHAGVCQVMSRNRFEEILRYFHVNNNATLDKNDKFTKVRPLFSMINANWLKYFPNDAYVSIDESMVPYYGRHGAKQHLHGKPIRFGYKVWSLCTRLGYVVQVEPYQGAATGNTNPEIGVGGSVVMNLVKKLPTNNGFSVFFDNFFTSLGLLEELKKLGHDGTGTIRPNRVADAPILEKKDAKQMPRGGYFQTTDSSSGITLVQYNDNNIVIVASNKCGVNPVGTCSRWSNQEKKRITLQQPSCISQYNTYMGGVDRLDQNISVYRTTIHMKKWYWPLLMFLLNASMNNAYQLYRLTPTGRSKESIDYLEFIRSVVQTHMAMTSGQRPAAGRTPKTSKKRVTDDVRLDGKNHFVISSATQVRCGQCHKNTTKKCGKCNVGCHVNCFVEFHK